MFQAAFASSNLRQLHLCRSKLLHLVSVPGLRRAIPTALRVAWCRTFPAGKSRTASKKKSIPGKQVAKSEPGDRRDLTAYHDEAATMGVRAFNLLIELLRSLQDRNVITIQDGLQIMSASLHPPIIPGASRPFEMSEHVRSRLSEEIGIWVDKHKQKPTG